MKRRLLLLAAKQASLVLSLVSYVLTVIADDDIRVEWVISFYLCFMNFTFYITLDYEYDYIMK